MLDILGCEVVAINDEPTGLFAHTPEPTSENVKDLCSVVTKNKAAIGFAQDPDADRLAIVDESGKYIGEEYTLALAAKYVFGKQKGLAAANLSTSRMIDDAAAASGSKVLRTPVGEANVAHAMIDNKCIIGGEGNGGVIDLRVGPVRDSLVGIALVLQMMAESGKSIGTLAKEIPAYTMIKDKVIADKSLAQKVLAKAKGLFADAKLDIRDGYRFDFSDGWIHLRTSNTEPVMRIIAEAKSECAAQKYVAAVKDILKDVQA
jgi:phosphomannomutase